MSSTTTPARGVRQAPAAELYHSDGYTWAIEQADALRRRDFNAVDWDNVIEEIEDLSRSEERSLKSQYAKAIEHLLKLQYRRQWETGPVPGWRTSANNARREIEDVLRENPGLRGKRDEVFAKAWRKAKGDAIAAFVNHDMEAIVDEAQYRREQKRLSRAWNEVLPAGCPYTRAQVEASHWWPERRDLPLTLERPQPGDREPELDQGR